MNWILIALLAGFLCVNSLSCSHKSQQKPQKIDKKASVEIPKLVGKVASVPLGKGFVLIQSYQKWNIQMGEILTTRGPNKLTANLRVTGETLGEFAAADIQSGLVEVGDAVYSQHEIKSANALTHFKTTVIPSPALPVDIPKNN